jgi:glycyl-tRNA synthetase beta chain
MANFLLEVGTEELPANFVGSAIAQWQTKIPASLSEEFLQPGAIEYYGTPRRLEIFLPSKQIDRKKLKGLPLEQHLRMVNQPKQRRVLLANRGWI